MGGLIIRASLKHLEEYKDKFFTFMTLSSPHLGFLYSNSKMVDAGIFLKFFKYLINKKIIN